MQLRALLPVLALVLVAGCSSEDGTGSTAESPDTEVRVGVKKSISGLRMGKYTNTVTEDGDFTKLTLSARTARTRREWDGTWSGTIQQGSGTKNLKGGFTIVTKTVPMPTVSGRARVKVIKFFDQNGALYIERSYANVQNSVAFYNWTAETEQIMDLVADVAGNRPFELDCTLTELHDSNVFEEGLSMEEYPDIDIDEVDGKLEISLGAASYDGTDNDPITVKSRSGSDIDLKIDMLNAPGYSYRVAVVAKKGVIEVTEDGSTHKVADFTCR